MSIACPNCNSVNDDNVKFCPVCGNKLIVDEPASAITESEPVADVQPAQVVAESTPAPQPISAPTAVQTAPAPQPAPAPQQQYQQPQQNYYQTPPVQNNIIYPQEQEKIVSVWGWVGYLLLFQIPIANIIALIVILCSGKSKTLKNFIIANFIIAGIVFIIGLVFVIILAATGILASLE